MTERRRRTIAALIVAIITLISVQFPAIQEQFTNEPAQQQSTSENPGDSQNALAALEALEIKGRAPKTGYDRDQFYDDWAQVGACDTRNLILQRDLREIKLAPDGCKVESGILDDPYTGKAIVFTRGPGTSGDVQVDHVVALSDAWQKGAQYMSYEARNHMANDPLELIAVSGEVNQQKGGGDAATWLPPNKSYRCRYVARQVAVKQKYKLWITQAEYDAIKRVLSVCPDQVLPIEKEVLHENSPLTPTSN